MDDDWGYPYPEFGKPPNDQIHRGSDVFMGFPKFWDGFCGMNWDISADLCFHLAFGESVYGSFGDFVGPILPWDN